MDDFVDDGNVGYNVNLGPTTSANAPYQGLTASVALSNANNDAATWPDCAAGSGDDTIILPAGQITLAIPNAPSNPANLDSDQQSLAGDLDITSSMARAGGRITSSM